ncbi:MAG: chemotaxis protein CheA [Armatimonadota bacterium]|nr:MAG: chemotaxis protein CheA [Armatimonadota bacterium]
MMDTSEYIALFLEEAAEQINILEQDILLLEQSPSQDVLNEIFRAAHTLKGSSRAMGFTAMGELTHAMEDVFDALRKGEISVSTSLVNRLFDALDTLKAMRDQIAEGGTSSIDCDELVQSLRNALQQHTADAPAANTSSPTQQPPQAGMALQEYQREAALAAIDNGLQVYHFTVRLAEDTLMKSVRALMVLQAIDAQGGTVIASYPDEDALDNEQFADSFELLVATDKPIDHLRNALLSISEVREVEASPWQETPSTHSTQPAPRFEREPEQPAAFPVAERAESPVQPAVTAAGETEKTTSRAPSTSQTVRVDVARLDTLLNLVGELVIDRTRIAQLGREFEARSQHDDLVDSLLEAAGHIGRITDELQEHIMKARMLPIEHVFNRFPRMIRDLAQKFGKEVRLVMEGQETELDRSVIEIISDPLIHMLRNSVDHGIEPPEVREAAGKPRQGTIRLSARHEENYILIEIEDDGKGMDPAQLREVAVRKGVLTRDAAERLSDKEALHLIFAPGFSTAKEVTEVSGRGVGMDIVRNNIQRVGGIVDLESTPGKGTRFSIRLPLTLAIIRALLVRVAGQVYAIPLSSVLETLKIQPEMVQFLGMRPAIVLRGRTLPLVSLKAHFYGEDFSAASSAGTEPMFVVVVGLGERQVGLVVSHLIGEQEIVIKSLSRYLGEISGVSGATILGDGRVALILEIADLFQNVSARAA